jgi:hypothetical protein
MAFADAHLPATRLILYHKHNTSARLLFLLFPYGVLAFSPLPATSIIVATPAHGRIEIHPSAWVHQACEQLGLPAHDLKPDVGFHAHAVLNAEVTHILLANFTRIEPPFEMAQRHHARFEPLSALRARPKNELALLRLAYEHLMT